MVAATGTWRSCRSALARDRAANTPGRARVRSYNRVSCRSPTHEVARLRDGGQPPAAVPAVGGCGRYTSETDGHGRGGSLCAWNSSRNSR